ncbi:hypothetical protein BU23DRAFT_496659 [Bimuria novae-zelandiae CBS 107.79]|uniref:Uncharacterized protein n=1 Tax=Bimuria novae-zelandiae CBS 107.79 TaxID=1447943 RepID=A0A6A5VT61_9PLEO|nr:hypothetical protein BU23DRAFT_496659 [Bimuria novae-zelandiae CBS 107.79]
MSTIATKVMSLSSTSGPPTPPPQTPCSDSSAAHDYGAQPDFEAIGRILGPIQEDLNEQAEVAMLPSPPINTPEAFSPAPSVYRPARNRGFSLLGDRLAQLKLHERSSPHKDSDCASSNRSVALSNEEDDRESMEDDASSVGARSTGLLNTPRLTRSAIPIALGSARLNPRIEEYVHFSSKDLPVTGPVKLATSSTQAVPANDGSHTRGASVDTIRTNHTGVTEKSTWAEEVEDATERAFLRLEQLAYDEATINPQRSMEDYYVERLQRLLLSADRKVKLKVSYEPSVGSSASSPATTSTETPIEVPDEGLTTSTPAVAKEATKE